jgi:D-3-phosphoglycerate dehydrogenase
VLAQSDIVSLHLSLNDETRGFISAARLAQMKPSAILVNTARAGVVEEAAVIARLKAGQLGHYATDVFMKEPTPPDEPLLKAPNVTVTSHAGYNTPEAARTMYRRAIDLAAAG